MQSQFIIEAPSAENSQYALRGIWIENGEVREIAEANQPQVIEMLLVSRGMPSDIAEISTDLDLSEFDC